MLTREILQENIRVMKENISHAACSVGKTLEDILIVAAIKTQSVETIAMLKGLGINCVGENRVQEMVSRYDIAMGLEWHFIGQLQTNKVKYIVDKVSLIQSLDRLSLAEQIDKEAKKHNIIANVLIEINSANELNKGGIELANVIEFAHNIGCYKNISIKGIMSVMPNLEDKDKLYYHYSKVKEVYDRLSDIEGIDTRYLSLGMSNDYQLAIKCGSNMIRPGRVIFGERS